jgi:hypothetical protein
MLEPRARIELVEADLSKIERPCGVKPTLISKIVNREYSAVFENCISERLCVFRNAIVNAVWKHGHESRQIDIQRTGRFEYSAAEENETAVIVGIFIGFAVDAGAIEIVIVFY